MSVRTAFILTYAPLGPPWNITGPTHKIAQAKRPSNLIMAGDAIYFINSNTYRNRAMYYDGDTLPDAWYTTVSTAWQQYPAIWHTNGCNFCFWDGHAEWVAKSDFTRNKNNMWGVKWGW